jgi:hypothetical protein
MKHLENIHPPVTPVERATGCCPLIQATLMLDQLKNYFWTELPDEVADEVAAKAEIVFARNEAMRRRFKSRQLAQLLPGEFAFGGKPLPPLSLPRQLEKMALRKKVRGKSRESTHLKHYAHGYELLAC